MRDRTGGWGRAVHLQMCAEYYVQCVADALEESRKLTVRLATAMRRAGKIERSEAELEGSGDIVNRCGIALERSGMASLEVTSHVEASGLTDATSNATHGTRICVHGYAVVAIELAWQSEWGFKHHQRDDDVAEALVVVTIVMIRWV